MSKRRQQTTPASPDTDLRKQLHTMTQQMRDLNDQLHVLQVEVKQIPRLPRALVDPPPKAGRHTGKTSGVLRYHEHASREQGATHWRSAAVLYFVQALTVLFATNYQHTVPIAVRAPAACLYLGITTGSILCLWVPLLRVQLISYILALSGACLALSLSWIVALRADQITPAIWQSIFWIGMALIHWRFSTSIRGRIDQRLNTVELIDKFEREETSKEMRDAP